MNQGMSYVSSCPVSEATRNCSSAKPCKGSQDADCDRRKVENSNHLPVASWNETLWRTTAVVASDNTAGVDVGTATTGKRWHPGANDLSHHPAEGGVFVDGAWQKAGTGLHGDGHVGGAGRYSGNGRVASCTLGLSARDGLATYCRFSISAHS